MQLNLINDLMDHAKICEGKFKFDNEFFDLYLTAQNALNQVKFSANQKSIKLELELKNEISSMINEE